MTKSKAPDLEVAALSEGFEALEWASRQWTLCVLKEARENSISREELDILKKGIFDGRQAFLNAWTKFVRGRMQTNSFQDLPDIADKDFIAHIQKAYDEVMEESKENGETTERVQE